MAVYSVFDWANGKYQVYQDQRQVPLMSDPSPCPRPRPYSTIGYDINDVLCVMPGNVQALGYSDTPKGQIVRMANGKVGVPTNHYSALARGGSPNLGGVSGMGGFPTSVPVLLPDGGMGYAPAGLGAVPTFGGTFASAIFWNVAISVASGILSTLVWRHALKGGAVIAGQKLLSSAASAKEVKRKKTWNY